MASYCHSILFCFIKQQFLMSIKYESGDEVQMIIKTTKESQSGLFSNQRLLLIKAGIVSYFSSVPKQFIGNFRAIQLSKQIPKLTIPAHEITKIEINGDELSLLVHKSRLITREDLERMVKGDEQLIDQRSSTTPKNDSNAYEQWIFKCSDTQHLLEFYKMVNLFRTGNPKFQPRLSIFVEGFQSKKSPRKKTLQPSEAAKLFKQDASKRLSEIPWSSNKQFTQKQKNKNRFSDLPFQSSDEQNSIELEQPHFLKEVQNKKSQEDRLSKVKDKIANANQPRMETIEQKLNEDKCSDLSKAKSQNKPMIIEFIKTYENTKEELGQRKSSFKQSPKNIPKEFPKEIPQETPKQIPEEIPKQIPKQIPQEIPQEISKTVQKETIILPPIITKTIQEKTEKFILKQSLDLHRSREKKEQASFNSQFLDLSSRGSIQLKQKQKKKINQLLKAYSLNANYDYNLISQVIGMSQAQLKEFIKNNLIQEDSCWNFIQNQLAIILNDTKLHQQGQSQSHKNIRPITDTLIENYHSLQELSFNSELQNSKLLQGQISYDSYQSKDEQEQEVLKWMKSQMNSSNPKPFSTKILNKFQYKIAIRPLSFNKQQIICSKGSWVVNIGGHLQQFLAYLNLQRIIKQIQSKQTGSISIECEDVTYLKYKEYQAIVKQLRVGYSCYPLKSIRALQFISKSKHILSFQKDFPQFLINVEVIKQGQNYIFHLDRTSSLIYRVPSIKHQLKRLLFSFDNELDVFFQTEQFRLLQQKCFNIINQMQINSNKITEEALYQILSIMDNNLEVDIICKLLGARIDKQSNIFFHPTALRLCNRQFGEEISLIRKARKKGDIQFSRNLSKKVMSKLQYYKLVTPVSNFIQIYLHLIDLMIIQTEQLQKAVPVLLKVLSILSQYEIEQYPVYLLLMKTYLKLNQINNFIIILQNCRLFLSQMFKAKSIIFDFPFIRVLIILAVSQNPHKGLQIANNLIDNLKSNTGISQQLRLKYLSKVMWDKCNILIVLNQHYQAYLNCQEQLAELQQSQSASQSYWVQGVLCLGKCWYEMAQVNVINGAIIQKRIQRAIQLALFWQNYQITFMLLDIGQKILQKCKERKLPRLLETQPSFQQAKIQFNATRQEMFELIEEND